LAQLLPESAVLDCEQEGSAPCRMHEAGAGGDLLLVSKCQSWLLLLLDVEMLDADSWEEKLNSEPAVIMVRAISDKQLFLLWLAGHRGQ